MAFQSAAGYGSLPNGAFSPTMYSKKVLKQFRKSSVAEDIVNNNYMGEISNFGDTVKILREPEINVSAYARGTQVTPQDLEDSDFTLTIDRANSFAFKLDDIEDAHAHVDWVSMAKDRAAYRLADTYDADILGYMSGFEKSAGLWVARTTAVGTAAQASADSDELLAAHKINRGVMLSTSDAKSIVTGVSGTYDASPLAILNRMNRLLDQKNADKEGRWIVVDPVFAEVLMDEDSKFMNHDYQGSEALSNGRMVSGKVRGFKVYLSNNLPSVGTGPGTATVGGSTTNYGVIVAGHDSAVSSASQITKTEKFRDTQSFADIVRGLHLYGRKIIRPEALVRANYSIN